MRVVTRSDLDGLVCAVLLKEVESIDEIMLVDKEARQIAGSLVGDLT